MAPGNHLGSCSGAATLQEAKRQESNSTETDSKEREKKMQNAPRDPCGALQAHSLAASLPPPETSAAPLTLVWDASVSGQVEAKESTGLWPSGMNAPEQCREEAGRTGLARNANFQTKSFWVTAWPHPTWQWGNWEWAQGGV